MKDCSTLLPTVEAPPWPLFYQGEQRACVNATMVGGAALNLSAAGQAVAWKFGQQDFVTQLAAATPRAR